MASTASSAQHIRDGPRASAPKQDENAVTRSSYSKVKKVGEGTYASVFLAIHVPTGRKVAIKKIKITAGAGGGNDGLDPTALREVGFLREMKCDNVIALLDVFSSGHAAPSLNLVLEFLDTNMEALIKDRALIFTPADVKSWMIMMLRGLEYVHACGCLHRDMKPNNLLISPSGVLKLADFGLARELAPPSSRMTNQVITLWYRPPELLLGARHYSSAVDLWSAGAIFAEVMLRTPYMPGQETDLSQLEVIFKARGSPTVANGMGGTNLKSETASTDTPASQLSKDPWPGLSVLPGWSSLPSSFLSHPRPPNTSQLFGAAGKGSTALLDALLSYDPLARPTANAALKHPYFNQYAPKPTKPDKLPRHPTAAAGKEEEVAQGLLSDRSKKPEDAPPAAINGSAADTSGVKGSNGQTKRSAAASGGRGDANGKRPKVTKEIIEERRRIARKMAFG